MGGDVHKLPGGGVHGIGALRQVDMVAERRKFLAWRHAAWVARRQHDIAPQPTLQQIAEAKESQDREKQRLAQLRRARALRLAKQEEMKKREILERAARQRRIIAAHQAHGEADSANAHASQCSDTGSSTTPQPKTSIPDTRMP